MRPSRDEAGRRVWSRAEGRGKLMAMRRLWRMRTAVLVASLGVLGACYPVGPGYRSLHEVDGEVVSSRPPPPSAYEAYLRARLALEQEPPALDDARFYIAHALEMDPGDPHLWATHAEIEERAGQVDEAMASARHALELRPGYPPAERVLARLESAGRSGVTASTDHDARLP